MLGTFDVDRRHPLNTSHRLHANKAASFMALHHHGGGGFFYDLTKHYRGVLTSFGAGGGWVGTSRRTSGPALKFVAASTNRVVASTVPILAGLDLWTVACWFTLTGTGPAGGQSLYCERGTAGNDILKLNTVDTTTTTGMILVYRNDAGSIVQLRGTKVVNDGLWHRGVITKNSLDLTLYVDGRLDVATTWAAGSPNAFTDAGIEGWIGGDKQDATAYSNATIDAVDLWANRSLTPAEIYDDYLEGRTDYPTSLNRTSYLLSTVTGGGGNDILADWADHLSWSDGTTLAPRLDDTLTWIDSYQVAGSGGAVFTVAVNDTLTWTGTNTAEPYTRDLLTWDDEDLVGGFVNVDNFGSENDVLYWHDAFVPNVNELGSGRYRR